jgi:hypothetical protein
MNTETSLPELIAEHEGMGKGSIQEINIRTAILNRIKQDFCELRDLDTKELVRHLKRATFGLVEDSFEAAKYLINLQKDPKKTMKAVAEAKLTYVSPEEAQARVAADRIAFGLALLKGQEARMKTLDRVESVGDVAKFGNAMGHKPSQYALDCMTEAQLYLNQQKKLADAANSDGTQQTQF